MDPHDRRGSTLATDPSLQPPFPSLALLLTPARVRPITLALPPYWAVDTQQPSNLLSCHFLRTESIARGLSPGQSLSANVTSVMRILLMYLELILDA